MAGMIERIMTKEFTVSLDYASMGIVSKLLDAYNPKWKYDESVSVTASVPVDECERISRELEELKARRMITSWE